MYKLKHQMNAHEFSSWEESSKKPSMTLPDQSLSIRDLYDRYSKGLPLNGVKDAVYYGEDDDIPDFRTMDLAEREDYIANVKEELEGIKKKRQTEIDKKRKDKEDEYFRKRLELELEKRKAERNQGQLFEDKSEKPV